MHAMPQSAGLISPESSLASPHPTPRASVVPGINVGPRSIGDSSNGSTSFILRYFQNQGKRNFSEGVRRFADFPDRRRMMLIEPHWRLR
jgi:hypothetical protein